MPIGLADLASHKGGTQGDAVAEPAVETFSSSEVVRLLDEDEDIKANITAADILKAQPRTPACFGM